MALDKAHRNMLSGAPSARESAVQGERRPMPPVGVEDAIDANLAHPAAGCDALATLDARLARHIRDFECGVEPRVWHLAAARGLYALIGQIVREYPESVRELSMVGAPHWLLYSEEQVRQHA